MDKIVFLVLITYAFAALSDIQQKSSCESDVNSKAASSGNADIEQENFSKSKENIDMNLEDDLNNIDAICGTQSEANENISTQDGSVQSSENSQSKNNACSGFGDSDRISRKVQSKLNDNVVTADEAQTFRNV